MSDPTPPRVAIVHDWLIGGGAERVVQALHELYPDAPIYTSYSTPEWRARLDGKVVTGFLQKWPFPKIRKFVGPLRIWWFTHLDLSTYDLVISSSGNGEAFGVRTNKGTTHICYCHTPTHYYWRHYDQYLKHPGFGLFDPIARLGLKLLVGPLRKWDYKAAQRPNYFIANSTHIQSDIQRYYGRDSVVIHPPIDVARFEAADGGQREGFVTAGRQVPAKQTNLIVEACTKLGAPLKVIGRGPEHTLLKKMAGPTVTFLNAVSDDEMAAHFAGAKAFVFASYDDFGITPIEAMAAGTPVIAFQAGGALDYVVPGKTGVFFDEQTVPALRKALRTFDDSPYKPGVIRHHAEQFSPEVFKDRLRQFIDTLPKNR
ncbi:MAG: glycosyltransferase [Candidatus Saccharimonadales bacterium]